MSDDPPADPPPPEAGEEKVVKLWERKPRNSRLKPVTQESTVAARLARAAAVTGPNCPYEPVGYDGANYWVLCCERHLHAHAPRDFGEPLLQSICGRGDWLQNRYPRFRDGKPVRGFVVNDARADLMHACQEMGYFSPSQVRNVGAWLGADGDLILHRGDHLYIKGAMRPLGRVGEHVYIPGPPLPPVPKVKGCENAAGQLLDRLENMPLERGSFDAMLLLGQLGVCIVGGALKFRPHQILTGEAGAGKTTEQNFVVAVLTNNGVVTITNATAAGIWQALQGRSIPIAYDEFEPERDPKKMEQVLALARQASTGGMLRRGSSNHVATEFPIVSPFLCSAILAPALNAADASRFVSIEIRKAKFAPPPFSVDRLELLGAQLTSVLAHRWPLFQSAVLPEVRRLIMERGYPARIADTYGTLIALVGVALFERVEDMRLEQRIDGHQMQALLNSALDEQTPEWRRCADYLLSGRIEKHRTTSDQFGELIEAAARPIINPSEPGLQRTLFGQDDDTIPADLDGAARSAQSRLAAYGLRVARMDDENGGASVVLQIANNNQQLAEVFEPTRWRTSAELATGGGWTRALKRAPGAFTTKTAVRFRGGVVSRAVCVPLVVLLQPGTQPTAPRPEQGEGDAAGAVLLH